MKSIFARLGLAVLAIGFVGGDLALPANNMADEQGNTDKAEAHESSETNTAEAASTSNQQDEKSSTDEKSEPKSEAKAEDQDAKSKKDKDSESSKKARPRPRPETEGFDIVPAPWFEVSRDSHLAPVYRELRQSQLSVKFATAEHGNVAAFDESLKSLNLASQQLALQGPATDEPPRIIAKTISHLKHEVAESREAAAETLFGRFPLIRAFGITAGDDDELEVHSYTVPGVARRKAVEATLAKIAKSTSSDPLHVILLVPGVDAAERTTSGLAELVDAEAPGAFANVADARLYAGSLRADLDPMPAWDSPDPAVDAICRQFLKQIHPEKAPRSIVIVMVREFVDEQAGNFWVQGQQRTYELSTLEKAVDDPEKLEADKVRVAESFTHDRSRFALIILAGTILLYVAALSIRSLLSLRSAQNWGWMNWWGVPSFGYLLGLVLTPLIMLALKRGLPDPHVPALAGAWWPCTAGALSLILPAGVFRMGAGSAGRYLPNLSCHGHWGIAFVAVALGTCAAWLRPAFYVFGPHSWHLIAALAISAALLVYCFGRAIDVADHFPLAILPITLILALVFGAGAFLGSPWILWAVACAAATTTAVHTLIIRHRAALSSAGDDPAHRDALPQRRPRSLAQLRLALQAPLYQPPPEFERLRRLLVESGVTRSTWIGLVGPSAAGKTAAARQLISELQSTHDNTQILVGRCTEDGAPYQPFREALAELGVSARLLAARSQGGNVNNIIERLADEFIPFWDFFSGSVDEDEEDEKERPDLLAAITNGLHTLSQDQTVVLFLDDVQWLDESSTVVLKHLREHFGPDSESSLIFIVASREPGAIEDLDLGGSIIELTAPSAGDQARILEHSLGIERASARHVVNSLGVMSQEAGGMFWLLRAIQELADENAFSMTSRGFALKSQYLQQGRIPVPTVLREKLVESLRAAGEHQPVLECAALLGEKFRVDDVAECLNMDRLKLLQVLRHLDHDLQLVRDIPSDEECYAFSSAYLLEIVREELRVGEQNGRTSTVPSKIARELHARIAAVFERRIPRTSELTYAIARHYFAAGSAWAAESIDRCRDAARIANRSGAHNLAKGFQAMAEQSARIAHRAVEATPDLETHDLEPVQGNA